MKAFVIAAIFAVFGFANAGLINSGLINSGLISPLGVRSIATAIPATESTIVAGPSGTIIDNKNIALATAGVPVLNNGLISPVIAARSLGWNGLSWNNGLNWNAGWNNAGWNNAALLRSNIWAGAPIAYGNQLW